MKKLFQSFSPVGYEKWLAKIEADLKGKPLDVLRSHPEPDLEIVAYHHAENSPEGRAMPHRAVTNQSNNWNIRQCFFGTDENALNKNILHALNEGVNHIGLSADEKTKFEVLTKDVLFEHIFADIKFTTLKTALAFKPVTNMHLNFDPIALNAATGNWQTTLDNFYTFYTNQTAERNTWVSGYEYGAAGASTIQELAYAIGHANEYIQFLVDKGHDLKEINANLAIELSVNDNYFVNCAKFRVIRQLIGLLFKGYDADYEAAPVFIYAKTNIRHLAKNDKNNNALRQTTQAMSGVIGGCDVLTINYGTYGTPQEVDRFERIAKNIQLILKEEAYLDKVIDPSAGSYYIEALTAQLLEKSWNTFINLEENGGFIAALKENKIQDAIEKTRNALIDALNTKKKTFLGVNKYPNTMEKWTEVTPTPLAKSGTEFKPIIPFYLEGAYVEPTKAEA